MGSSDKPKILGISAFYHDSAATLLRGEEILAAVQEERFSRKKHDPGFPSIAIKFCLESQGVKVQDLDAIVFYDKPFLKFERLLESYLCVAPRGYASFIKAMPIWLRQKLLLKTVIKNKFVELFGIKKEEVPNIYFTQHHESHAASAFYPSPFSSSAVLCLDGVGEWATTSAWVGEGKELRPLWQINFPHSLGLLYSAFTYYLGFKVNSGEYKLMGLAPYGKPKYYDKIMTELIDVKPDGSFRLNMKYFGYLQSLKMTNGKFDKLFSRKPRVPESVLTEDDMDMASSVQKVIETVVLKIAKNIKEETGAKNLCLAGGVALNCVANGKLDESGLFENIWIQPAAGDAGGSLGAAQVLAYLKFGIDRNLKIGDNMQGAYLGNFEKDSSVRELLASEGLSFEELTDEQLISKTAKVLSEGNIVGWFQGRMEFGPRALGNRSILADPRSNEMQKKLNLKIKYRESFRPFAPAVLEADAKEYFGIRGTSPYMLMVAEVTQQQRTLSESDVEALCGTEKLKASRSKISSVTHVDFSARVQTVSESTNKRFFDLITEFKKITGCSVLINTSFNVRGEPIVCTAKDAVACFFNTEMDYLVIGNFILDKKLNQHNNKPKYKEIHLELD